jgi:putative DNA primase/helicase
MTNDANSILLNGGAEALLKVVDSAAPYKPSITAPSSVVPFPKAPEQLRGVLETQKASAFAPRGIRWLWPNRFARGKLGLIGGLPDRGKGLISADLIACVTANRPLPCGEGHTPQGNVIYFTAEDGIEDTVVPRLMAAGANLDLVHIVQMMHDETGKPRTFNMITDLPALRSKVEEIGNVVLVIIDPMSAYLGVGKVNASMTTDVRGFLKPLTDLAEATSVAVIGIMHFNKKADVANAMLRIADSLAYVAAARHVYFVVDDAEVEKRRLFCKAKNNLAPDTKALSYMTGARKVGVDKETQQDIWAPHVLWGNEYVEITATDAMQAEAGTNHSRSELRRAKEFLQERLANGPVKAAETEADAEGQDISRATLRRARKELGIKPRKEKGSPEGVWIWQLPEDAQAGGRGAP